MKSAVTLWLQKNKVSDKRLKGREKNYRYEKNQKDARETTQLRYIPNYYYRKNFNLRSRKKQLLIRQLHVLKCVTENSEKICAD